MVKRIMDDRFLQRAASQVYLMREINGKVHILFGMRDSGEWDVAAGHCERGETFTMAAHRETLEEFGVKFDDGDIAFTSIIHMMPRGGGGHQYINAHFFVKRFAGTPKICEPDHCQKIQWFPIDNLPKNLFCDRQQAIDNFIGGITYLEIK
jgi:ADP-ribose pyrophosphatase YjhB (NUDIX family)